MHAGLSSRWRMHRREGVRRLSARLSALAFQSRNAHLIWPKCAEKNSVAAAAPDVERGLHRARATTSTRRCVRSRMHRTHPGTGRDDTPRSRDRGLRAVHRGDTHRWRRRHDMRGPRKLFAWRSQLPDRLPRCRIQRRLIDAGRQLPGAAVQAGRRRTEAGFVTAASSSRPPTRRRPHGNPLLLRQQRRAPMNAGFPGRQHSRRHPGGCREPLRFDRMQPVRHGQEASGPPGNARGQAVRVRRRGSVRHNATPRQLPGCRGSGKA